MPLTGVSMDSDDCCLDSTEVAVGALVVLLVETMRMDAMHFGWIDYHGTSVGGWRLGLVAVHSSVDE